MNARWLKVGAGIVVFAGLAAMCIQERSPSPENAFEDLLSGGPLRVNSDFRLLELEGLGSPGPFVGSFHAAYDGPDDFDGFDMLIYEEEAGAEQAWDRMLEDDEAIETEPSTRQPRFDGQVCTLENQTIKCSVRMYEAILTGFAGMRRADDFDEESVKANAQILLMAAVKHWLDARGLELPRE